MADYIILLDKNLNFVKYDLHEFFTEDLETTARKLGFESTLEFMYVQFSLMIARLYKLIWDIMHEMTQMVVESLFADDYEAKSNHYGE